jgi:hypothetical protein
LLTEPPVLTDLIGPPTEAPSAAEPIAGEPSLPEDVIAAEAPPVAPSPVLETPVIHADSTIRGWFSDVFSNLIATGRVREREAEVYLQDLLKRLGL